MTRDQQVSAALKLLNPPQADRDARRKHIEAAVQKVQFTRSPKALGSKKVKAQAESYLKALRRTQVAYQKLDPALKALLLMMTFDREPTLRRAIFGKPPSGLRGETLDWGAPLIGQEIANTEFFLKPLPRSGGADVSRKRNAVAMAYELLTQWGHEPVVTRGGDWDQLSAALAGTDCGFFKLMSEFKNGTGQKIVPDYVLIARSESGQ